VHKHKLSELLYHFQKNCIRSCECNRKLCVFRNIKALHVDILNVMLIKVLSKWPLKRNNYPKTKINLNCTAILDSSYSIVKTDGSMLFIVGIAHKACKHAVTQRRHFCCSIRYNTKALPKVSQLRNTN
jgi:hypothetical protein